MCSPRHYRLQTSPNNTRHIMDTHTFLHTGSGLYNPLYVQQSHTLSHGLIEVSILYCLYPLQHSTTLYSLHSTAVLQSTTSTPPLCRYPFQCFATQACTQGYRIYHVGRKVTTGRQSRATLRVTLYKE